MRNTILKTVLKHGSLIFGLTFLMSVTKVTKLEKCLTNNPNQNQSCLAKHVNHITLNSCYSEVAEIKSQHIQESLKEFCFYQVSEFPSLNSCLVKAELFFIAENHDAAVLNCFLQFQENISRITCQKVANSLRLPEKKTYLKNHCESL